jgi:hypothetical protein
MQGGQFAFIVPLNRLNNERRADIWYKSALFNMR